MILILSCSLSSDSNSRLLALEAQRILAEQNADVMLIDLRDHPLPLCDGGPAYKHPNLAPLRELIGKADAIIIATPVYNYDASAAAKNLIELTGRNWENKVVGFLCAAGGMGSYMSVMSFANSLMLDFRCLIVPRFVYALSDSFVGENIVDPELSRRVGELARATARLGELTKAA